jgi:ureidoglycolate lyase
MREIAVEPIDAGTFAPFGTVLSAAHGTLTPWNGRVAAAPVIEILQAPGPTGPDVHVVEVLERHLLSTQAFVPIGTGAYLVVVAGPHPDGGPDISGLCAFQVPGSVVVQYHAAVWHAPITALAPTGLFAMHVHKDRSPGDCEFVGIPPVAIQLAKTARQPDPADPTPAQRRSPSDPNPDRR